MSSYPLSPAAPIQVEAEPNSGLSITRRGLKTIVGWLPGFGPGGNAGGGGPSLPAGGGIGQVLKILSLNPFKVGWAEDNIAVVNGSNLSFGQTAGTATEGNDPRVVGAMQKGQNGADIPDKGAFRTNLNLGGAASLNAGVSGGVALFDDPRFGSANVDLAPYLRKDGNLAGLDDRAMARANLGLKGAAILDVGVTGGVMGFSDPRVAGRPIVAQMPSDGSDGTPAFVAACNAVMATPRGGTVIVPAGRHNMLTRPTVDIPGGKRLLIVGAGAAATSFLFPTTPGFIFNYGSKFSSLTLYDFEVVCNRPNAGTAIRLTQPTPDSNPADTAQNHFYNITVRGEAGEAPGLGYVQKVAWWDLAYDCQNVSNCHWNGGLIVGATPDFTGTPPENPGSVVYNPKGWGVRVTGSTSGQLYAAVYNFFGTTFNWLERGFIYGAFIQGVTMHGVNFTQCIEGVFTSDPAGSELHGLNITQSQFGCTGHNINLNGYIGGVTIDNNLIVPQPNQNGIRINSAGFTITGNAINGLFANGYIPPSVVPGGRNTNDTGISVINGGSGVIDGNSFGSLFTAIYIAPGVSIMRIGTNARVSCVAYVNNAGSGCTRVTEVPLESSYN